jgi:crotonobetainyl-CoA:carnitine CoA-transferase CaiB-like acyl-CoA transferase
MKTRKFWYYNRGKKSLVLDLQQQKDCDRFRALVASADILLESTPKGELDKLGMSKEAIAKEFPTLIHARVSPFGDEGPWANFKASDLVHLALGGVMMNCGYDPDPSGKYDLPPIAPQMWHAYHVAGEQLSFTLLAALLYRFRTGKGQLVSCAVHESVSKSTEVDLMTWVMRRALVLRQTCRHARESVSPSPSIAHTKDGRWVMASLGNRADDGERLLKVPAPARRRRVATRAWRPFSVSCARLLTSTFRGAKRRNWECSGRRLESRTRMRSIRTGSSAGA